MASLDLGTTEHGPMALPLDAQTTTFGIIGRRGSGKTSTAVVLAEEMIGEGLAVVVLDPLGVWHGLRSSKDGEHEGLPVTILGGNHGDLPLERTAGALVADLIVEHPGAYVLDLSAFESRAAERQFATDFAERLYRAKAKDASPLCLIVDEADTFAPQQVRSGEERLLGAFEAIARRGRVRGLGMVLITQRPAVLNKNLLSQVECLIAMQITAPQDRDALKAWAQGFADKPLVETFIDSLAPLKVGEAWLWSPSWLGIFERVNVRQRHTFDSSALRSRGLAAGREPLQATHEGIDVLGDFEPLPTGAALLEHWYGQLEKAPRLILQTLADAYPAAMTPEQIAAVAGYEASGGGFRNALGKLRTLELIERGAPRLSDDFFGGAS